MKCRTTYNTFFKKTKIEGVCDNCSGKEFNRRVADTEETLEKRLDLYKSTIIESLSFYEKKGLGMHIDANQNPTSVFKDIQEKVF